jgi:2-amino-4-hydroxy-6-hydroxymethyldihydropteridine diphosphokinase
MFSDRMGCQISNAKDQKRTRDGFAQLCERAANACANFAQIETPLEDCPGARADVHASTVILALGANLRGRWGTPGEALGRACQELAQTGLHLVCASRIYTTTPLGPGRQTPYLNAVLVLQAHMAPGCLLRLVKRIERRAGRRLGSRWGPRCLDIDVVDQGGRRIGRASRRRIPGRLILPHPEVHRRAFVLVPLLDVVPAWCHPVLGIPGRTLLARLGAKDRANVRPTLDFVHTACDKQPT